MSTLLLRFAGPMQSWGIATKGNDHWTAKEPTKSGVIGMLGAALGVQREDRAAFNNTERRIYQRNRLTEYLEETDTEMHRALANYQRFQNEGNQNEVLYYQKISVANRQDIYVYERHA